MDPHQLILRVAQGEHPDAVLEQASASLRCAQAPPAASALRLEASQDNRSIYSFYDHPDMGIKYERGEFAHANLRDWYGIKPETPRGYFIVNHSKRHTTVMKYDAHKHSPDIHDRLRSEFGLGSLYKKNETQKPPTWTSWTSEIAESQEEANQEWADSKWVIWSKHPSKGLFHKLDTKDPAYPQTHTEWHKEIGLPSSGSEFDKIPRGRVQINRRLGTVTMWHHTGHGMDNDTWRTLTKSYDIRPDDFVSEKYETDPNSDNPWRHRTWSPKFPKFEAKRPQGQSWKNAGDKSFAYKYWYNHDSGKLHRISARQHHIDYAVDNPDHLNLDKEQEAANTGKWTREHFPDEPVVPHAATLKNNIRITVLPHNEYAEFEYSEPNSTHLHHAHQAIQKLGLPMNWDIQHEFRKAGDNVKALSSTVMDTYHANHFRQLDPYRQTWISRAQEGVTRRALEYVADSYPGLRTLVG